MEAWLLALVTAVTTGLVTWGGIRVELRWLRRDVDLAHDRISRLHKLFDQLAGRRRTIVRELEGGG